MADRKLIGKLTGELAGNDDVERRRDAAGRLRTIGFAARNSLEKRGSLVHSAESGLHDNVLAELHSALSDEDREVRLKAITVAGDLGDERSLDGLVEAVEDEDLEIRLAAIDSLGDIGGIRTLKTLADLARDTDEDEDVRLAVLTELEELAAKNITSGPDRRFDPPAAGTPSGVQAVPTDEAGEARLELLEALTSIQSEDDADDLLRLKAADVQAYLESGAS